MKRLNIDLEDELHKELKIKAAENGYTISEYIRSQIEMLVIHKPDIVTYKDPPKLSTEITTEPTTIDISKDAVKAYLNTDIKVCKNGHILNKFGKCMEKGCKYS